MFDGVAVRVALGEIERNSLKELSGVRVGVLVGLQNIGAVAIQDLREGGDEASSVLS